MSIGQQETAPTPKTIHNLTAAEAYETQQHMACAGCWEPVVARITDKKTGTWTAECGTTDCSTPGFVTWAYIDRRKAESAAELATARETLREAAPWMNPHKGKTAAQILGELGF